MAAVIGLEMNVIPITHCVKIFFPLVLPDDTLGGMRISVALLFFALSPLPIFAEVRDHATASGGVSPDGRYEVRIYEDQDGPSDPSNYFYAVFDTRREKIVAKLSEGGGFCDYNGALSIAAVVWNPSSTEFALLDHGTRHSMELYVFRVTPAHLAEIALPDYLGTALGRVGAKQCYDTSVVGPVKWIGASLDCHFVFDAYTKQGRSGFYETTFTLKPGPTFDKMALGDMTEPSEKD